MVTRLVFFILKFKRPIFSDTSQSAFAFSFVFGLPGGSLTRKGCSGTIKINEVHQAVCSRGTFSHPLPLPALPLLPPGCPQTSHVEPE